MRVEVELSASLLFFTRDLREGLLDTVELPEWHKERQPVDVVTLGAAGRRCT